MEVRTIEVNTPVIETCEALEELHKEFLRQQPSFPPDVPTVLCSELSARHTLKHLPPLPGQPQPTPDERGEPFYFFAHQKFNPRALPPVRVWTVRVRKAGQGTHIICAIDEPTADLYILFDLFVSLVEAWAQEHQNLEGLFKDIDPNGNKGEPATATVETIQKNALPTKKDAHNQLTPREREVADLIADGLTQRSIAEKIMISRFTVKSHANKIGEKLNIKNRNKRYALALREMGYGTDNPK